MTIKNSVGTKGRNNRSDVLLIQQLLNKNIGRLVPLAPLTPDGQTGPATEGAITEFQTRIVQLARPDGRVDPGGTTLRKLVARDGKKAPPPVMPRQPLTGPKTKSVTEIKVTYKSSVKSDRRIVSEYAISVITEAMSRAGCSAAVITSTLRLPAEQAAIMYRNAKVNLTGQYKMYGSTGDKVLDVFVANKDQPKADCVAAMTQKIKDELAKGRRTSKHVTDVATYKTRNIIDIGMGSTSAAAGSTYDVAAITKAFTDLTTEGYIAKFIDETKKSNKCWHIEVIPNAKPLP